MNIRKMAIYPPLGIARVGNSGDFFLASDLPGQAPVQVNGFKDEEGRVKKQAALFRVYALDENGQPIKEITSGDGAVITWRVNMANRKASWYQFMANRIASCMSLQKSHRITATHLVITLQN